jgi:Spy/CpxP family protein refolding chaperone
MLLSGITGQVLAADKDAAVKAPATEATTSAGPMMGMGPRGMMVNSKLSDATKKMIQETMQKVYTDNQSTLDSLKKKREEMSAIMKAPKFDKAAYMAKASEIRDLHNKMSVSRSEAFASAAEKMTAEERASWADHTARHNGKMGKRGMRGNGPRGYEGMMGNMSPEPEDADKPE